LLLATPCDTPPQARFRSNGEMALCGIDLGTTNSLIAYFGDGGPKLVSNAHGEALTPSVVGLDEDGTVLVGKPALERLLTHPDKTVASFKRFMGTSREHQLGSKRYRPEELSALVLRCLKEDAEAQLGVRIADAIISVPAYFNDHQRKATLDAGRLAGLHVERLVNEPTAAALAYGLNETKEGKFLIFDLGGGTFDVSILDKYEGVMEVRATAGDTFLGGDDFTRVIEEMAGRQSKFALTDLTPGDRARLRRAAESAKRALTRDSDTMLACDCSGRTLAVPISREQFESGAAYLLRKLRAPLERAISDAVLAPEQLDCVVLVGGATRMPMVRSLVARLFGKLPLIHIDPDTTVALGAAVQSGLKARAAALSDVVMTDVCPHTLGIASIDDPGTLDSLHVSPIIERNAVVPISRTGTFRTVRAGQKVLNIDVYQGEHLRPENNIKLGTLTMSVPPGPAFKEAVDVRFTYDINGALEVEATVVSTGKTDKRIFRNETGLSETELAQRFASLASIKLHPREQAPNKALLARAERLYAEHRDAERDYIRQLINEFTLRIADQRIRELDDVRAEFAAILDRLERSPLTFQ
jgi:molecular chaperone HscC